MSGLSFRFRVSFLCVSVNCVINLKTLKYSHFDISNFYGGDEPENPSIPSREEVISPDLIHLWVSVCEKEPRTVTVLLLDIVVIEVVDNNLAQVEDGHAEIDLLVEFQVNLPHVNRFQVLVEDSACSSLLKQVYLPSPCFCSLQTSMCLDLASRVLNEFRLLMQRWTSPLWSVTWEKHTIFIVKDVNENPSFSSSNWSMSFNFIRNSIPVKRSCSASSPKSEILSGCDSTGLSTLDSKLPCKHLQRASWLVSCKSKKLSVRPYEILPLVPCLWFSQRRLSQTKHLFDSCDHSPSLISFTSFNPWPDVNARS